MFKAEIKTKISAAKLAAQMRKEIQEADGVQAKFDSIVAKDTNEFVPMDTGMLAGSVLRASNFGDGELVYDEPYASRLYCGESFNFSRDMHPKATHHWFEKAKSIHLDKWGRMLARLLGGMWRRNG